MTEFVWDGSHLVQEINRENDRTFSYIYRSPQSYEPLAQVCADNNRTQTRYFHCDQIGVPRELTDENGNLCWYGDYLGWGKLRNSHNLMADAHQPFRLQNQYTDEETGLHYNFFRYYDPHIGRFTQLDPIGLLGGENLYQFAANTQTWIDPFGLKNDWYGFMGVTPDLTEGGLAQAKSIELSSKAEAVGEYTIGVQTPISGSVVNSNMGLILTKPKDQGPKICKIFVGCGGASVGTSKIKTGVEGIFSSSATNEGISTSICSTGTLAYRGGVTGSRCRGQDGSITYSAGPVLGAGIQYSEQVCVQETSCF